MIFWWTRQVARIGTAYFDLFLMFCDMVELLYLCNTDDAFIDVIEFWLNGCVEIWSVFIGCTNTMGYVWLLIGM